MTRTRSARASLPLTAVAALLAGAAGLATGPPAPSAREAPVARALQTPAPAQPSEFELTIAGDPGTPPRFAVPDFIDLGGGEGTAAAAATIAEVLWDDLEFEREFYMIPRDTYASIPAARSFETIPFDRWRELGADGLVIGTVRLNGDRITVQVRLFNIRSGRSVFGKEYTGSLTNPRLYAHTIADEIHQHQRGLRGVARTKLTFSSDRDGEQVRGPVDDRNIKEVYISDYDAANQRRLTVNRSLNITPVWSADGRAVAYTSYRSGFPDIYVSRIFEGVLETPAGGTDRVHNWLPAWSPDGTRIALTSNRDGNPEIYVINADGGNVRRLTNHPAIDSTPTWSPAGNQVAFTSDRSGRPQIYIVDADGLNLRRLTSESFADRATWAPAPFNEIAYAARNGPGYDIKVFDVASGAIRQITFGIGSNESPAYAPNGRHLAFTSTRSGMSQIYTIARDGKDLRQITNAGNNFTPAWSP